MMTTNDVLQATLNDVKRLTWHLGVTKNDVAITLDRMERRLVDAIASQPSVDVAALHVPADRTESHE